MWTSYKANLQVFKFFITIKEIQKVHAIPKVSQQVCANNNNNKKIT